MDPQGRGIRGRVLQVACVYGNLTEYLLRRLRPGAHLHVVDVAPIQLRNLQAKVKGSPAVSLQLQDASDLHFADASHEAVLLFFLLHEMPVEVRRKTLSEAWRVVKPGGKLVVVDYHRPRIWNPLRYVMVPVLRLLEPFAMDLWKRPVTDWLPALDRTTMVHRQTYFGGLYQRVVVTKIG
jgi:ubiquinone/menaquinone biosynthesis C-methylase UbiE